MKPRFRMLSLLISLAIIFGMLPSGLSVGATAAEDDASILYSWYGSQANGTTGCLTKGYDKFIPKSETGYTLWNLNADLAAGTYKLTIVLKADKKSIASGRTATEEALFANTYVGYSRDVDIFRNISLDSFSANDTYQAFSGNFEITAADVGSASTVHAEMRMWTKGVADLSVYKVILSTPDANVSRYVPATANVLMDVNGADAQSNTGANDGTAKAIPAGDSGSFAIWGINADLCPGTYKLTYIVSMDKSAVAEADMSKLLVRGNSFINLKREEYPGSVTPSMLDASNTPQAFTGSFTVLPSDLDQGTTHTHVELRLWTDGNFAFKVHKVYLSGLNMDGEVFNAPNAAESYSSIDVSSLSDGYNKNAIVGNGEWASNGEQNPWAQINWTTPVDLNAIGLRDRLNSDDNVNAGLLTFSDGSSVEVHSVPGNGNLSLTTFPLKKNITWVRFQVVGGEGPNGGLEEFSAYQLPSAVLPAPVPKQKYAAWNGADTTMPEGTSNDGVDRVLPVGYTGYGMRGANVDLAPGKYKVTFILSVDTSTVDPAHADDVILRFNPVVNGRELFPRDDIKVSSFHENNAYQAFSSDIEVLDSDLAAGAATASVEARLYAQGFVTMRLHKIIVSDTSYNDPADGFTVEGKLAPKAPYRADTIYAVNVNGLSAAQQALLLSLQGIAAKTSTTQIYVSENPRTDAHLNHLKSDYGVEVIYQDDIYALVGTFRSYFDGYILYHYNGDDDPSINVASSLAGPLKAIAVDDSIEGAINSLGISNRLMDVRGKNEQWCFAQYWELFNHQILIEQKTSLPGHLRDYAAAVDAFVFFDYGGTSSTFRDQVLEACDDNFIIFGWNMVLGDEVASVTRVSAKGGSYVAADFSRNLSTMSGFDSEPLKQQARADAPAEENVHYVCLAITDGDNEQLMAGGFLTDSKYYGSQYRGKFNMAWPIAPALYDNAPSVLDNYYQSATAKDQFMIGPSGTGYIYQRYMPADQMQKNAEQLNELMGKMDTRIMSVIDDRSIDNIKQWDVYTAQDNIDAIFYLDIVPYNKYGHQINWSNGKPVISCSDIIWDGIASVSDVATNINNGSTNIHSQDAYSLVFAHCWSGDPMANLNQLVDSLDSDVRVVTPEQYVNLIQKNIGEYSGKVYEAEQQSITTGVGAAVADGQKATAGTHSAGYLVNGDAITGLPAGENAATFSLKLDSLSGGDKFIARLEAWDADTNTLLASRSVKQSEFMRAGGFEQFRLAFSNPSGHGVKLRCYWYGNANLTFNKVTLDSDMIYEAEGPAFSHKVGRQVGDGWQATVSQDGSDHMLYGPYVTTTPQGQNQAIFRFKTGSISGSNADIVTIDVNDTTAGSTIASRTVKKEDFKVAGVYQDFILDYTNVAGHSLEFRMKFLDKTDITVDKVINRSTVSFMPANLNLQHGLGVREADGWSANKGDGTGYLVYGPYVTDLSAGSHTATFRAMVEKVPILNYDEIMTIEAYDATAGTVLASSTIKRNKFGSAYTYKDFSVSFTNTAGHALEFRVYFNNKSYLKVDRVTVSPN